MLKVASTNLTLEAPVAAMARKEARVAQRLGDLARGRVSNAWMRMAGAWVVAAPACLVAGNWIPALWALGFSIILFVERMVHRGLAAACDKGVAPKHLAVPLLWTMAQSAYANTITVWMWFTPSPHSETAALFFLMAGLTNAAATLHADTRFMIAGVTPSIACLFGLPIAEFVMGDYAQPLDLIPALAAVLFLMFGVSLWRTLRASEAAHWRAERAAMREQQAHAWAQEASTETLARVQDELRTPLTAVIGAAEKLRRLAQDKDQAVVLAQTGAMLREVMQDLSRPEWLERGAPVIRAAPFDPREVARAAVGAFFAQAQDRGLELFLDIDAETPEAVELDGARLLQILLNLIANAVANTRHGGVRVRLQSRPAEQAGIVRLGFCVADTGVGMSRSQLAMLFNGEIKAENAGRGLGIVRRYAAAMRARITTKSELGEGSLISLILDAPIAATASQSRAAQ